jgi:hypothetical protein
MLAAHGAPDKEYLSSGLGGGLTALEQVVDAKQDESPNQRHEEARGLIRLIVADKTAEPGPEKRTGDANEHRNEDAARVSSWNDEFGDCTDNKTDKSRPQQMKHSRSSVLVFPGSPGTSRVMGKRILLLEIDARD